jgi:hypothetical protein
VLGAVRGVQQGLGARIDLLGGGVQQQIADLLAHRRSAGLARRHDVVTPRPQPLDERLQLRRLSGALSALEDDEETCVPALPHAPRASFSRADRSHRQDPSCYGEEAGEPQRYAGAWQIEVDIPEESDVVVADRTRDEREQP